MILLRAYRRIAALVIAWLFTSQSSATLHRLGTLYGGWWICPSLLEAERWAICCGAGEDISFDVALNAVFGARIICVDPTPRAKRHVGQVLESVRAPRQEVATTLEREFMSGFESARFRFLPCAVWSRNEIIRLYEPKDPSHVSHSAVNLQRTERFIEVEAWTLERIVAEVGGGDVTLVKLDIEGAEYEVLDSIVRSIRRPKQLLVEFDEFHHPKSWTFPWRVVQEVRRILAAGYALVRVEAANFLFIRGSD